MTDSAALDTSAAPDLAASTVDDRGLRLDEQLCFPLYAASNPIESTFDTICHQAKRLKVCLSRTRILHMMFKLGRCAEKSGASRCDVVSGLAGRESGLGLRAEFSALLAKYGGGNGCSGIWQAV